jgi:hypothetical protein
VSEAERLNEAEQRKLSALEEQAIANLVNDFPRVWHDPRTSDRDRKRMVRLLLEDGTVLADEEVITAHVRFKGGAAEQLNQRGWRTFAGKPFDARRVLSLRRDHQLKDHGTRLRERGLLSADEAAKAYGVCRQTMMDWGRAGLLPTYRTNERGMVVFPPPDEHTPQKNARKYQTTPSSYERSAVCN